MIGDRGAGCLPSEADVARIAAIANPVLRNLEITECYARLSAAFALAHGPTSELVHVRHVGLAPGGPHDPLRRPRRDAAPAASAAPRSCGGLSSRSGALLLRKGLLDPGSRLGRLAAEIHSPFDAFERASSAVARGNLKVFAEIGREFARYLHACPADAPVQSPAVIVFLDGLRPGDPPDGQAYLRRAFSHYQQQAHEADPPTQAGLVLLANLCIGLHEQMRLQPEIAEAVDAPLATAKDLGARVLTVLVPGSRRWPAALRRPAAGAVGWVAARLRTAAVRLSREVITERLMVLAIPPDVVLSLGRNLDAAVPAVLTASAPCRSSAPSCATTTRAAPATRPAARRTGAISGSACTTSCTCSAPIRRIRPCSRGRSATSRCARSGAGSCRTASSERGRPRSLRTASSRTVRNRSTSASTAFRRQRMSPPTATNVNPIANHRGGILLDRREDANGLAGGPRATAGVLDHAPHAAGAAARPGSPGLPTGRTAR